MLIVWFPRTLTVDQVSSLEAQIAPLKSEDRLSGPAWQAWAELICEGGVPLLSLW